MTCTHAALKRGEFLELGLKYDNLVMEEAAQILDVETFVPMVLQACALCCVCFSATTTSNCWPVLGQPLQ